MFRKRDTVAKVHLCPSRPLTSVDAEDEPVKAEVHQPAEEQPEQHSESVEAEMHQSTEQPPAEQHSEAMCDTLGSDGRFGVPVVFDQNGNYYCITVAQEFPVGDVLWSNQTPTADETVFVLTDGSYCSAVVNAVEQETEDMSTAQVSIDIDGGTEPCSASKPPTVRKKVAKPHEWKRNRKKASREHGERYVSVSGKTVLARAIRVANHSAACRMGCEG